MLKDDTEKEKKNYINLVKEKQENRKRENSKEKLINRS